MTIRDPGGLYSYLATPYDAAGRVDTEILEEYVRRIIAAGVTGVSCIASTCEGPYLTDAERTEVLRTVCRTASGKVAINVGIGAVSTHQATIHARQAEDLGATSLMVEFQQYFPASFDAAHAHYQAIADASSVPIRLYNLTLPTHFDFTPDRILAMSSIDRIASVKEASNDVSRLRDIRMLCGDRYTLYCGFHYQALEGFRLGAQGWEVMMHPLIADRLTALYRTLTDDPWSETAARRYGELQPLFHFFKQYGVPQSIKEISARTDLRLGAVRAPLPTLAPTAKHRLHAIIEALDMTE